MIDNERWRAPGEESKEMKVACQLPTHREWLLMRGAMFQSTLQWMNSQGPRAETRVQLVRECVTWVGELPVQLTGLKQTLNAAMTTM